MSRLSRLREEEQEIFGGIECEEAMCTEIKNEFIELLVKLLTFDEELQECILQGNCDPFNLYDEILRSKYTLDANFNLLSRIAEVPHQVQVLRDRYHEHADAINDRLSRIRNEIKRYYRQLGGPAEGGPEPGGVPQDIVMITPEHQVFDPIRGELVNPLDVGRVLHGPEPHGPEHLALPRVLPADDVNALLFYDEYGGDYL